MRSAVPRHCVVLSLPWVEYASSRSRWQHILGDRAMNAGWQVQRAAGEASGMAALLNDTLQQVQRLTSDNRELRRKEEDAVLDTQAPLPHAVHAVHAVLRQKRCKHGCLTGTVRLSFHVLSRRCRQVLCRSQRTVNYLFRQSRRR